MLKGDLLNFTIAPTHDPKQALRIRRFFMAGAAYIACLALVYISYYAGFMEWTAVSGLLVVVPVINIFLYLFFHTSLNLKMADPSLTAIQICAAIVLVMYVIYFTYESVGVLLLVYVIILMFGIYKLNTKILYISAFLPCSPTASPSPLDRSTVLTALIFIWNISNGFSSPFFWRFSPSSADRSARSGES